MDSDTGLKAPKLDTKVVEPLTDVDAAAGTAIIRRGKGGKGQSFRSGRTPR